MVHFYCKVTSLEVGFGRVVQGVVLLVYLNTEENNLWSAV